MWKGGGLMGKAEFWEEERGLRGVEMWVRCVCRGLMGVDLWVGVCDREGWEGGRGEGRVVRDVLVWCWVWD